MVCLVLFYCVTHYDTFGENASGENDKAVIYPNLFFSPPDAQLVQNGHQGFSSVAEAVFYLWWNLRILSSYNQPV